jgi:SAM-dependent methyltransferase
MNQTDAGDCRACRAPLRHTVVDLGLQPLADSYPSAAELAAGEPSFPLHVMVCDRCWLVQLRRFEGAEEILAEHTHAASSYSDTLVAWGTAWTAEMLERCPLPSDPLVLDVASNDGYLLRNFVDRGMRVLGFEIAASNVEASRGRGVTTRQEAFTIDRARELAGSGRRADLIVGNHSLANADDLAEAVEAMRVALAPGGRIALEFHHVLSLVEGGQFDVVSHAHCLYLSLLALEPVMERAGLSVVDAELVDVHGGSVRLYAAHAGEGHPVGPGVKHVLETERAAGLDTLAPYQGFGAATERIRADLVGFLEKVRAEGSSIAAYGAPAKGNTLLNFCRVTTGLLPWTVDRSPLKQGNFLPGSNLPIAHPDRIAAERPDYVLVLPWSLAPEITRQLEVVREWGGRFVVAMPELRVLD